MSILLRGLPIRATVASFAVVIVIDASACAAASKPAEAPRLPIEALWVEPADLESRDLRAGPQARAPEEGAAFTFLERDTTGHSNGYRVKAADGREWKVKTGDEAQSEVVVSRILWAIGYHQPPVYYVKSWRLTGGPEPAEVEPGRFRLESGYRTTGTWSWTDNPFVGTQPLRGLVVVNVLLNNWDLTPSQNRIYAVKTDSGEHTRFVVQDLGASLGKSRWPLGSRNKVEHFEAQGFVLGTDDGRVKFDFHGAHRGMLRDVTAGDVVWACKLLARLTERQLQDAFAAAGYEPATSARFIAKIRAKIQEGLALEGARGKAS
jgi:hypothetical protein